MGAPGTCGKSSSAERRDAGADDVAEDGAIYACRLPARQIQNAADVSGEQVRALADEDRMDAGGDGLDEFHQRPPSSAVVDSVELLRALDGGLQPAAVLA
jgi:hypothetical protein